MRFSLSEIEDGNILEIFYVINSLPSPCSHLYTLTQGQSFLFVCPMPPPRVLVNFVVLPPGHGSSVTDSWGWDAHEAQLRCPDDVSGDIGGWSARRALNL